MSSFQNRIKDFEGTLYLQALAIVKNRIQYFINKVKMIFTAAFAPSQKVALNGSANRTDNRAKLRMVAFFAGVSIQGGGRPYDIPFGSGFPGFEYPAEG
jgi:hypothetical protein